MSNTGLTIERTVVRVEEDGSRILVHIPSASSRISVGVYSVRPGDWVASVDDRDVARGPDLAAVVAVARDKVRGAVAELARAVGLEVVGG